MWTSSTAAPAAIEGASPSGVEVVEVPDAEADGRGVEALVGERQCERVAADPLDLRLLPPRPLEHRGREVEAGDLAAGCARGDRQIAGAAADIEHAVARTDDGGDRQPPPAAVGAGGNLANPSRLKPRGAGRQIP